jgi:hypothetical protein
MLFHPCVPNFCVPPFNVLPRIILGNMEKKAEPFMYHLFGINHTLTHVSKN